MLYDTVLELLINDSDAELERLSKLLPCIAIEGLKEVTKIPLVDLRFHLNRMKLLCEKITCQVNN